MNETFDYAPPMPRTIDVTPGAQWRETWQAFAFVVALTPARDGTRDSV